MSDDSISRKEAIEWVQNILAAHLYYHPYSKSRNVPIDEAIDRLERLPSIDAVPVVRCRDCIHRPTGTGANHDLEFPDYVCPCQCDVYHYSWMPKDDWFCGDGEKKKEKRMSEIVREMTREELVSCINELRAENKKIIEKLKADAPNVDATPVVRCQECKHKDKYENFCWSFLREIDPCDYCSWAERKEE